MIRTPILPNAPDVAAEDYCVFGLATCFVKEDGEVKSLAVVEPIPSAALEALLKGIPTSYQWIYATSLGQVYEGQDLRPLADWLGEEGQYCDDFEERLVATARTYTTHPAAQQHLAKGDRRSDLNYSLERKRMLNAAKLVRPEDNVKQHPHTHQVL